MIKQPDSFVCPNCGEDVSHKAKACPHCGSDENTGWSNQTYLDGIDLPDDETPCALETGESNKNILAGKNFFTFSAFLVILILLNWIFHC